MVPTATERKATKRMESHCFLVRTRKVRHWCSKIGLRTIRPMICSQNTITVPGKLKSCRLSNPSRLHSIAAITTAKEPKYRYFFITPFCYSPCVGKTPCLYGKVPTVRSAHDFHMILSPVGLVGFGELDGYNVRLANYAPPWSKIKLSFYYRGKM